MDVKIKELFGAIITNYILAFAILDSKTLI